MSDAVDAIRHEESTFEARDGVKLYEQRWLPRGEPRAVVVLQHGLKDHSSRYGELTHALASRGIAVHAADLRGHAKSGGKRVSIRKFDEYLDDFDLVVNRARKANPGKPLFLFGHSMGGAISLLYTATRKAEVTGVITSAAALKPGEGVSPVVVKVTKVIGAIFPGAKVFKTANADFSRDPAVVKAMDDDPLIFNGPAPARLAAQLLKSMDRNRQAAPSFTAPLLGTHGSADKLVSPDGTREFVARAGSSDKTLKVYDGFVHDLVHEPGHEALLQDIASWVELHLA